MTTESKQRVLIWNLLAAIVFLVAALWVIRVDLSGEPLTSTIGAAREDQNTYHLPQIRYFAEQPLRLDYSSLVATTPGAHLVLAGVAVLLRLDPISATQPALRLSQLVFGLLLVELVWWLTFFRSGVSARQATVLILPFCLSPYVINGAAFITTDNGALAWTLLTLLCLIAALENAAWIWAAGIAATLAVLWRQVNLWLIAPIAFTAYLRGFSEPRAWRRVAALGLPLVVVGLFALQWRGLTPPEFQSVHSRGLVPASLLYSISLFGVLGIFFCGFVLPGFFSLARQTRILIVGLGVALGIALFIGIPSSYDSASGRWGGVIWTLVRFTPAVFERSLLLLVLVPLGLVSLFIWQSTAVTESSKILMVSFWAWALAGTANLLVFHRYYEPFLLAVLPALGARQRAHSRYALFGPLLLAILQAAMFSTQFLGLEL